MAKLVVLTDLPTKYFTALEKLFADWDVPTVTVPTKRQRSDLYYEIDGHWNDSGHDFTANLVLGAIERFLFFPFDASTSPNQKEPDMRQEPTASRPCWSAGRFFSP